MELKSHITQFTGGMDLDSSISNIPKESWRYAENIRVLTDDDGSTGVLNQMDSIYRYDINSNWQLESIVLGVVSGKSYNFENNYTDVSYVLLYRVIDGEAYNTIVEISNFNQVNLSNVIVCKGYWGITSDVQMVLNCENRDVCKLYITDGETNLKIINIRSGYNREINSGDVDITGECVLSSPILNSFTNGSLPVGQVQYCYQLFSVNGIESAMSPLSDKIIIAPIPTESSKQNGYDSNTTTSSIGVNLDINFSNASSQFNALRLYRIVYTSSIDQPTIYLANESRISSNGSNITIRVTDDGSNSINQLTLEEFNEIRMVDFTAQTICNKDNRLFAANITETTWDVEYDTRAYRCNRKGIVKLNSINSADNISARLTDIVNGTTVIPKEHDCINPLNSLMVYPEPNDDNNYSYSVVNNGQTYVYGGLGRNVSYYFTMTNLIESENETVADSNGVVKMKYDVTTNSSSNSSQRLSLTTSIPNGTNHSISISPGVLNYSNPEIASKALSYQRDEIYRFGAVFYNKKGIASPVHWIGDIRFPSADCYVQDNVYNWSFRPFAFSTDSLSKDTNGAGNPELVSRPIGIRFNFSNIPEEVKAVEIVRCRRTDADRTVVTQGALSKTLQWDNWSTNYDDSLNSRDLRPFTIPGFQNNQQICRIGSDLDGDSANRDDVSVKILANAEYVYDFTSADQCFNKDVQIIRPGDYIIPLYVANSSIESTDKDIQSFRAGLAATFDCTFVANGGIQFQAQERYGESQYDVNYTGALVVASSTRTNDRYGSVFAISDGLDAFWQGDRYGKDNWIIPAAEFKYFKFYDKSNATGFYFPPNDSIRTAAVIDDVTIPANIPNTEAVTTIEDITGKYVDQIGSFSYQNISIGSGEMSSGDSPAKHTMWGIRGVTTLIESQELSETNSEKGLLGYKGIDTNISVNSQTQEYNVYGGSTEMLQDDAWGLSSVLICNIKRPNTSQYGGNSYFSRSNSIYNIHCGFVVSNSNSCSCNVFGGDTYLGILDHTHSSLHFLNDPDGGHTQNMRGYYQTLYPLESSVNVYLRSDEHFLQTADEDTGSVKFMTEVGINFFGSQTEPMYSYNSAYSNTDGASNKVQKGVYDKDFIEYPNRIVVSDIKTAGEITDSWSKFRFADYLDTDNVHGRITNLLNFNGRLFFFQDDALGIAQVNERSLITDENSAQLVLGTGTILGRYDYVVEKYGDSKIRDKSIVTSTSTIYWFDYDKNILCAYNNQIIELSKIKKVQSYINNLEKVDKQSVVSLYDHKYNEVWFNIKGKSLIFNEQTNFFTSFYTHSMDYALQFSDYISTINNNNIYYIHNTYNLKNDRIEDKTCKIQFVINDNYIQTKVYDNVFFDANFDDVKQITSIQFTTKTQYTDPIDYEIIDNREDTYRFFIPREHLDNLETQTKESMSYAARMRGKYLICDYIFDCNEERQMEIPFIKTTYRDSLV